MPSAFRSGDLVRVKDGCGYEGMIGIVIDVGAVGSIFWISVVFASGRIEDINPYWLEVISV